MPKLSSDAVRRFLPARIRLRWLGALALVLVPLVAQPAAAQRRDRSLNAIFRNDAPETATRVAAAPAAVWQALSEVYAELGLAMDRTSNAPAHEYLTTFVDLRGRLLNKPNGEWFACQSGDMLNDLTSTGQISFAVRTRVEGANGGSVLHTQIDSRARRRSTNSGIVDCATTGKLEERLAQLVQVRVAELSVSAMASPAAAPQPE